MRLDEASWSRAWHCLLRAMLWSLPSGATLHAQGNAQCSREAQWRGIDLTSGVPPGSVLRPARIAFTDDGAYVVGSNVGRLDRPPASGRYLTAVWQPKRGSARSLGSPDPSHRDRQFVEPFPFTDRRGRLHLLWGEPAPGQAGRETFDWPPRVSSVWHSRYSLSGGWSPPVRLWEGGQLHWSAASLIPARSVSEPDIGIAVPARGTGTLLVTLESGRWVARSVPPPQRLGGVMYATAAQTTRGFALLTVATVPGLLRQGRSSMGLMNQLHLQHSNDSGSSWSPARRLREVNGDSAMVDHPQVLRTGTGMLMIWLARGGRGEHFLEAASGDVTGERWAPASRILTPPDPMRPRVARDGCGNVHAIIGHPDDQAGVVLAHFIHAGSTWRVGEPPLGRQGAAAASLARAPSGDVWLTALVASDLQNHGRPIMVGRAWRGRP